MRTLIVALALTVLVGCGKKEESSGSPPATSGTSSTQAPSTGTNADAANALRVAEEKVAKPDLSVPKENYTAVTRSPGDPWATYVAVAFEDRAIDDKELLNLFSPRYFNEPDAFKKQEIAASELIPIKERLAAYKKQRYYSIPFGHNDSNMMNPLILFAGPYDFDKKSFPLSGECGGSNGYQRNAQNILVRFGSESTLCHLTVTDMETAKKIEALRASTNAHLRGTIYFFVRQIEEGNRIDAAPTDITYEVWDKPSYLTGGKNIGTFDERL